MSATATAPTASSSSVHTEWPARYVPKGSSRAQLLEDKANLQRMLVEIPLSEEERAAVEDGQAAVERLLERLTDVPTPAGPTPRWLGRRLPVIAAPEARREPIG